MKEIICPFCFEKIKPQSIEFRCANITKKIDGSFVCGLEPDEKLAIYRGLKTAIPQHKVFSKGKFSFGLPREANCPGCGLLSRDRLCPSCHNMLPYYYGDTDNYIFAVIGAKETGKSHYIAVLIDYIMNVLTESFMFSISAANDETSRRYKEDFRNKIFEQHRTILATQSGSVNRNVREPLIYELRFHDDKTRLTKTVTIVFFDTAGEDLNSEDMMNVVNRYIYNASGIIMLLDPLQLKGVRASLPEGTPLPEVNTEIETIIARVGRLIGKAKGLRDKDKIDIPLAVAFAKTDAIMPLLSPGSLIKQQGAHYSLGKFDAIDCRNVNDEIEALINQWAGNAFLSDVANKFSKYNYFGLSALGCNPHATGVIDKVIPLRVEDPFLWLLWQQGLIPAVTR